MIIHSSIPHEIANDAKVNVIERFKCSSSGTESASGQAVESKIAEHQRQQEMKTQTERTPETIQRNWKKYKNGEDRADEHLVIDTSIEQSTLGDIQDECKKISSGTANSRFTKRNSNEWTEEEKFSTEMEQQLEKMIPVRKTEMQGDEISVENAGRVELKKHEVNKDIIDSFALLKAKRPWRSNFFLLIRFK